MSTNRNEPLRGKPDPSKPAKTPMAHDQTGEFDYGVEGGQGQQHGEDQTGGNTEGEGTMPERRAPGAPSTGYEYPNGDRGDKSGKNLEQQKKASGTPGKPAGNQPATT